MALGAEEVVLRYGIAGCRAAEICKACAMWYKASSTGTMSNVSYHSCMQGLSHDALSHIDCRPAGG